jgi:hypothetical protein
MTTLLPNSTQSIAQLPEGLPDPKWLPTFPGIFRPLYYSESARSRYGHIFTFRFLN